VYRVRQFLWAAGAWVRSEEVEVAVLDRYLPPPAVEVFQAMPRYDQRHALTVFRTLQQQGHVEPDLLAAALLHDVGKSVPHGKGLRLWHRVAAVLLRTVWPGSLEQLAQDKPGNWRRPFFVQQHHAAFGAELAQQTACSFITVDLVRHHEDPPEQTDNSLLAALQAADSKN
jgi:hypothetical protein